MRRAAEPCEDGSSVEDRAAYWAELDAIHATGALPDGDEEHADGDHDGHHGGDHDEGHDEHAGGDPGAPESDGAAAAYAALAAGLAAGLAALA